MTAVDLCRLADAFIASRDVTQSSRQTYRRALKAFFDWLSTTGRADRLDRISRFDLLAYKDELGRTKRPSTANMYVFIVHGFYGWLAEHGACGDISKGIKRFKKVPGYAKDCLTVDQVRRVLVGIDRTTPSGMRDYAIVNLMARTALRDIEVARAKVGDVREEAGQAVLWVQGKGRVEADAFVVLMPAALEPIQAWMTTQPARPVDAPLFPRLSHHDPGGHMGSRSISKIVKDSMRRAGIDSERLTPHSLRHTAISLAILPSNAAQARETGRTVWRTKKPPPAM